MPQEVLDDTFQSEVLESAEPVLVDFWAPWCGPCKAMNPAVEKLTEEMTGKLKVVKCNTEEAQSVAMGCNVMSIPTFVMFKEGKEVGRFSGGVPYDKLKEFVSSHL